MNQVVNLRTGYAMLFGDTESQQRYEQECERARAAQTVRYAVAPRVQVTLSDGRVVTAGGEVRLEDFQGTDDPAWRVLERHVLSGRVLEATTPPPEAA